MKVSGGLIGITLNPSARNELFPIAPELARLAEEAKNKAGPTRKRARERHNLSTAVLVREERNVKKLTFTNPFTRRK